MIVTIHFQHLLGNVLGRETDLLVQSVALRFAFEHEKQMPQRVNPHRARFTSGSRAQLIDNRAQHRQVLVIRVQRRQTSKSATPSGRRRIRFAVAADEVDQLVQQLGEITLSARARRRRDAVLLLRVLACDERVSSRQRARIDERVVFARAAIGQRVAQQSHFSRIVYVVDAGLAEIVGGHEVVRLLGNG